MATDPVLQWKTHVTDSTDQDTILGNLDFLESFAGAITGDESLHSNFESIRKKLKDGTLKPTDWKSSTDFQTITTKLTESSSGKIKELDDGANKLIKRVGDAEGDIKSQGKRLDTAEGSITSYGTRISDAETALGNKLDSSIFEEFKTDDFKTITDWKSALDEKLPSFASATDLDDLDKRLNNVKTLLNNEVSHWTAETTPAPLAYTPTAKVKASTQPWGTGEDPEPHTDDLCTVIGANADDKGVSYRFIKHPTDDSYKWLKVIDNDGALALSKQSEFETAYNRRQTAIDSALDTKQPKGNYVEKTDFEAVNQEIQELKGTYKVTVTTQGEIRNGEIVGGTTHDSEPAIIHTAHVYGILGNKITDTKILNKLTWTVNSGRTSYPVARTVKGATCYVTAKDFVRVLHTQGSNPQYYDIELNSSF